jgi:hypothetical protein
VLVTLDGEVGLNSVVKDDERLERPAESSTSHAVFTILTPCTACH